MRMCDMNHESKLNEAIFWALALLLWVFIKQSDNDYRPAQQKTREAVLHENLTRMREVIDQYFSDKQKYPEALETLVTEGYFRRLPFDPITRSDKTWQVVLEEAGPNSDPTATLGITDVHSGAHGVALDGTPFSEL